MTTEKILTVKLVKNTEHEKSRLLKLANDEITMAETVIRRGLQHVTACGKALSELKEHVPHGEWTGYLKANFTGSVRTAQVAMRLYEYRGVLENRSDLSVRGALALIDELKSPSKKTKAMVQTTRLVFGENRERHDKTEQKTQHAALLPDTETEGDRAYQEYLEAEDPRAEDPGDGTFEGKENDAAYEEYLRDEKPSEIERDVWSTKAKGKFSSKNPVAGITRQVIEFADAMEMFAESTRAEQSMESASIEEMELLLEKLKRLSEQTEIFFVKVRERADFKLSDREPEFCAFCGDENCNDSCETRVLMRERQLCLACGELDDKHNDGCPVARFRTERAKAKK